MPALPRTHLLGYPRIGVRRELKRACEAYWRGALPAADLEATARELRLAHWRTQRAAGIDLPPANDFAYYDHVLDASLLVGALPARFAPIAEALSPLDLAFAMARGRQDGTFDVTALEMTKWFDTNYHYLVPEFEVDQAFALAPDPKPVAEFLEARAAGIATKPVLLGPVSFLLLGREVGDGFHRLELLDRLLPAYTELLRRLAEAGAEWVQLDEPCLALDAEPGLGEALHSAYDRLAAASDCRLLLANYFGGYGDLLSEVLALPVDGIHLDLVRAPGEFAGALETLAAEAEGPVLSLGLLDGRNVWRADLASLLPRAREAVERLGAGRLWLAPSCSLLHVPYDLDVEPDLDDELRGWLAFARQKLDELESLRQLTVAEPTPAAEAALAASTRAAVARADSPRTSNPAVRRRTAALREEDFARESPFAQRVPQQRARLGLPRFPTTTIGSFPQTRDIRRLRSRHRRGELGLAEYEAALRVALAEAIGRQEALGLDVLVHGEFERTDMVEYFGERLEGIAVTHDGWVQSYGSRCVKPPIIYGDVRRTDDITVRWSAYAQSLTERPVKGMLTGPVTLLQWSFVRDDQARRDTAHQLALAVRDEAVALESAGLAVVQIDEPALREGLPLRAADQEAYLGWAVRAFRLAAGGLAPATQVHTHMCYAEFDDIMGAIADLDADVITLETSRSQMQPLAAFATFDYPNEVGPGVYDIHSPRVPSVDEMVDLLRHACAVVPAERLWVNPDCGLKTRRWPEVEAALANLVRAARVMREEVPAQ